MIDENNVNRKDLSGLPLIERVKVLIYKTL